MIRATSSTNGKPMQCKSAASSCGETSLWSDRCLPFSETSFLVKCEIPLFYDKHVEVKFSDRAGPGSHNGYTRGFPTNGVYTLELQMESANLSSTTDESRVQLMSLEWVRLAVTWLPSSSEHVTRKNKKHKQRRNQGGQKDFQNRLQVQEFASKLPSGSFSQLRWHG